MAKSGLEAFMHCLKWSRIALTGVKVVGPPDHLRSCRRAPRPLPALPEGSPTTSSPSVVPHDQLRPCWRAS